MITTLLVTTSMGITAVAVLRAREATRQARRAHAWAEQRVTQAEADMTRLRHQTEIVRSRSATSEQLAGELFAENEELRRELARAKKAVRVANQFLRVLGEQQLRETK